MARVCLLLPSHWAAAKGGAEYQAHLLAARLAQVRGHSVVYLARRAPADGSGYPYCIRRIRSLLGLRFGLFWDAPSLYRALRDVRPEVIIQHVASAYTGIAGLYCKRHEASLIWLIASDMDVVHRPQMATRGVPGWIDARVFRYGVQKAEAVIAQTTSQARSLEQNYRRAATAVIPNFHPARSGAAAKGSVFTIIWVSNFKRLKRPEVFIDLATDLRDYPIAFRMIGRPEPSPWGADVMQRIARTPNLEYVGELELEEVNAELERAHLLVNTSEYEGFPNSFIQAWMRGVPTVTLGVDPDGVITSSGLGQSAGAYDELKAAVLKFFTDRRELEASGARARRFAEERFSLNNADRIIEIVEALGR